MGFDEESNAHQVYWEGKRSITVERSVKFNFEEEELTEGALFEGEWDILEDNKQSSSHSYPKATVEEITDAEAPNTPHNHPGDNADTLEIVAKPNAWEKRVRKPSSYI